MTRLPAPLSHLAEEDPFDFTPAKELGMGERLERGGIYKVDLTSGRLTRQTG